MKMSLFIPLEKICRQCFKRCGAIAENFQGSERAIGEALRDLPGFFEANDRGISRFLRGSVFAGGFAELLAGLRDIQNVVNDLEREADVVAEFGKRLKLRRSAIRAHAAQSRRAAEQRRGLAFVDVFELVGGNFFAFAFEVGDLSRDELQRTGCARDFENEVLMRVARPGTALRGDLERLRQERVPRQHGDAFAKNFVVRELAATIIVIVHRRQIVVDEGISVDAFHGAGERHRIRLLSTASRRRRKAKRGTHPLAAGKKRVTHRFVDGRGHGFFRREKAVERFVHGVGAGGKKCRQIERRLRRELPVTASLNGHGRFVKEPAPGGKEVCAL
jgi:hypothetical protein